MAQPGVYSGPHPAFHRGRGDVDYGRLNTWHLRIPAFWAKDNNGSPATEGKESEISEIKAEIALDRYHLGHLVRPLRNYEIEDIVVLPLWPFQFLNERCLGLGLIPTGVPNEYQRIGRVEIIVEHKRLRDWDFPYEEIALV